MAILRGRLEWGGRFGAGGWARQGVRPVELEIRADGHLLARVVAGDYRPDLARAGEGDGVASFTRWFAAPLPAGTQLSVTAADGTHLPGSPLRIAPLPPLAAAWRPDAGHPVALMVDEAAPDPARDAASAAVQSHAAALRALGYAVTLVTLAEAPAALVRLAGRVRVAWLHRMRPMLELHAAVRAANPGVRILFVLADLASLRTARAQAVLGGDVAALAGLRAAEAAALAAADVVVTHSPAEASLLGVGWPALRVAVVPWAVTPATASPPPFGARAGIGFVGNFGHAPNRDAALVLLDAVMPLVWQRGSVGCVIAGYGLPPALAARADARVTLLDSPDDAAASLWHRVRVSAAPLRFGAGIKGKVLDSLAHGVPCVCSPIAAEGLPLPPDLIAGDAAAMAARLWHLHEDATANAAAAGAALARVAPTYEEAAVRRAMALAVGRPPVIPAASPRAAPSPALRPRKA
jgi:glycosyltransferase involved in cell wall biosynthesis